MPSCKWNLGRTASYRARYAVWIDAGSLSADGFLAVTTVPEYGEAVTNTYGVQVVGGGKVRVWKLGGDGKQYTVTCGRCSCPANCGDRGVVCKHRTCVDLLVKDGLIRVNQREAT